MKAIHLLFTAFFCGYTAWYLADLGVGEILASLIFWSTFGIAWRLFRRDLSGMLLAGMIPGLTLEWITEAYWQYHLNVYFWRDVSYYVVLGWGYNFTFLALMAAGAHRLLGARFPFLAGNGWLLACDGVIGAVFFIANELIGVRLLGLWEYAGIAGFDTMIPGIDYPLEAVVGAFMIAITFPTFLRRWEGSLKVSTAWKVGP